jgi:hypothetical protein
LNFIWDRIHESFNAVDSVLSFERDLTARVSDDRKFSYETRGQVSMKVYSQEFSQAYSDMLDGQVERRMRQAVVNIGSYWYTAWIDGGQPDLNKLIKKAIIEETDSLGTEGQSLDKKLKVREHDN